MNMMVAPEGALTVACVLKQGGPHDWTYVKVLSQAVRRHLPRPFRFVCVTDCNPLNRAWLRGHRIHLKSLDEDWPYPWARLELFRPGLFRGRVLAFDLETMVTGDLSPLAAYPGRFAALEDFRHPGDLDAGALAWIAGPESELIHGLFERDPWAAMSLFSSDSDWIRQVCRRLGLVPDRVQDLQPGFARSAQVVAGGGLHLALPEGASLLRFTSKPMPHQLLEESDLVQAHWV